MAPGPTLSVHWVSCSPERTWESSSLAQGAHCSASTSWPSAHKVMVWHRVEATHLGFPSVKQRDTVEGFCFQPYSLEFGEYYTEGVCWRSHLTQRSPCCLNILRALGKNTNESHSNIVLYYNPKYYKLQITVTTSKMSSLLLPWQIWLHHNKIKETHKAVVYWQNIKDIWI